MDEKSSHVDMKGLYGSDASMATYTINQPLHNILLLSRSRYCAKDKALLRMSPVTWLVSQGCLVYYLFLRYTYTLEATRSTNRDFVAAWIFLASETVFALMVCK